MMQNTIQKLTDAAEIMDEVEALLVIPETGSQTIAAIQDVIETLLSAAPAPRSLYVGTARTLLPISITYQMPHPHHRLCISIRF